MKNFCFALCLCLCSTVPLFGTSDPKNPRVPPITISEAIKLVFEHHNKQASTLKSIFIDEAVFVRGEGKAYWRIGVRNTEYETGHLIYHVSTEGVVEIDSVVKDG